MLDCQIALLLHQYTAYNVTGVEPTKLGARHPSITPFEAFLAGAATTSPEHLVIAAGNDKLFGVLCGVLCRPEWAVDPRFCTNALRTEHAAELRAAVEAALAHRSAPEVVEELTAAGVPAALIHGIAAASRMPQVCGDSDQFTDSCACPRWKKWRN